MSHAGRAFGDARKASAGNRKGSRIMSVDQWSADQLGALADEWAAEREAFLSAVQTYLASHLSQGPAGQLQLLEPATYGAELAAIGERLSSFLRTLDSTPRYTIQHRVAEYQQALETQ